MKSSPSRTPHSLPEDTPNWLSRRVLLLKRTGQFSFASESAFDPPALAHPSLSSLIRVVKVLDISRTPVTSLAGCPIFPRLTVFVGDRSKLENFANFRALRSALTISLKETPISKLPTYRLSVLIGLGADSQLTSLDGSQISGALRTHASSFSQTGTELVNRGWIATTRLPEFPALQTLCEQFGVETPSVVSDSEHFSSEASEARDPSDFKELVSRLREEHREVWRKGKAQFGMLNDDDENLTDDVVALLQKYQLTEQGSSDLDVFAVVQSLCAEIQGSPS
jgi:hypothetical protein